MASDAAIEVRDIRKRYGRNEVLRGVTFSLEAGKFHTLVGHNGAGKSTLLRILGRHEAPSSGTGALLGRPLDADLAEHGRDVALVSEATDYAVPVPLGAFFRQFPRIHAGWDWPAFEAMMRARGLDLDKAFAALSRGQKMQVACAAALAGQPRVVLVDEITAVLDDRARPYFVDALAGVCRRGGTVLMATNLVTEASAVVDREIRIEDGRLC
jgi:ABC-type multidrug transport system ATPase subunit